MTRIGRRSFVKGAGLGGAAIAAAPLVRMLTSVTHAQTPVFPKRLVIFSTPNGTLFEHWWNGAGPSCAGMGRIFEPLAELAPKLLVLRGVDMQSAYVDPIPPDHEPDFPNALTGRQAIYTEGSQAPIGGMSVDQHIARHLAAETRFASLQLGVLDTTNGRPLIGLGPREPVLPERSPYAAFDRIFADVTGSDAAALARLRAERASVLDFQREELGALRCRLPAEDRAKVDLHLESIRELERSLTAGVGDACAPPDLGAPISVSLTANDNFPALGRLQMDVLAMALACDLTRVASLQWSKSASQVIHRWVDVTMEHHSVAHLTSVPDRATADEWLARIETWYAEQLAYLLRRLDAIPEGDGTLLDHTAVVWIHEQSYAHSHDRRDMPYVIAGSCGGYFRTGRCLELAGVPHNQLLVSLCHAMDVPTDQFGDPDFGSGPLAGLT